MIRLSIIVPFYNVEPYIEQCIRSLYNQDIPQEEYEVICVDDSSPDRSRAVVERLQKEYPTLRIVTNNTNKKLGGARNAGLDVAIGEYIWFVDSDDYIAPCCLKYFLDILDKNNLEVLHFDYAKFDHKSFYNQPVVDRNEDIVSGVDFVLDESRGLWSDRCPIAWNRIIRKEFLLRNNLRFVEFLMYEDTDYSLYMYPLVQRMQHVNQIGYYYRINTKSVTRVQVTGDIMCYKIMQQYRCIYAYRNAPNAEYRELVGTYIHRTLTEYRREIKSLSIHEKIIYVYRIRRHNINALKEFSTWRTWLAIRYGITLFF